MNLATRLVGDRITNPMPLDKYKKMRLSLERLGVKVVAATSGDDLRHLLALGAEATYDQGYITHIGEVPSASSFYEEIIHWTQARKFGELLSNDIIELCAREIEANRKMQRFSKHYGFDHIDIKDINDNAARWERAFARKAGVEYDKSGYPKRI